MTTKEDVLKVLKEVYDPEIPVNIVDLGLIYDVKVEDENVYIKMTLTAPGCPLAFFLTKMVEDAIKEKLPEIKDVTVDLVWDPPWTPERMSEDAKKLLGLK
ncbi:MAG: DUF59 domain-containing protein [Thermoproteales archaeon]|nr:DUF59 domain-containing protein [Thermoproteales archaeon]